MNILTTIESNPKALELMQPGYSALDYPAMPSQATAMLATRPADLGADALPMNPAPTPLAPVGRVALNQFRAPAWTPTPPRYRGQLAYQWQQLRYIVAVGCGERDRKRDALGLGGKVVFGTRATPIGGVGSCF